MDLITKSTNDDRCQIQQYLKKNERVLTFVTARGSDGDDDRSEKQRRQREQSVTVPAMERQARNESVRESSTSRERERD